MDALSHVLVVEDDAVIRRAVGRAAQGLMETRFAESVATALDALRTGPLPRFVLLDFVLPDGDGLHVLRHMRADARFGDVPVVLFSSLQDPNKAQLALQAGAQAWVRKPDDPRELREAVRALCAQWGGAPAAASDEAGRKEVRGAAGPGADPFPGHRFRLRSEGRVVAAARGCGPLRRSTDLVDDAGGPSTAGSAVRRSPGRSWFLPLVLTDVVTDDAEFEAWAASVGPVPRRRDLVLEACGDDGRAVACYLLAACWVSAHEATPQGSARGPAHMPLLRLEHEGWSRVPLDGGPSAP